MLAQWIAEAERPVILAGGGAVAAGAEDEIRALAERCGIPVAMSLPGMGVYPSVESAVARPLRLCRQPVCEQSCMANADLPVGIGTTFHVRQTCSLPEQTAPKAKIARIDIDDGELADGRRLASILRSALTLGDAVAALNTLLVAKAKGATSAWLATIERWKKPIRSGSAAPARCLPQAVIAAAADRALSRWLPGRHYRRRAASDLGGPSFCLRSS